MRLIDATIQPQFLSDYILERKSTFIRVLEKGDNDFLFGLLMDYFDAEPTAYDVDKVVGQLRKQQEKLETDIFAKESDNWYGQYCNGIHEGIDKAIEIIKAGGKNDNNL